jgi:1-acyl-sn-glycerol-3-phosphate acyltransferase
MVVWILGVGGVMRVEKHNADLLAASRGKPVLVLANHPCYLDILVLIALIPDALCVVKSYVWWNRSTAAWCAPRAISATMILRSSSKPAPSALRAGSPLIIFPEGTRTSPGAPLHFMRGAARIALASGAAIQPILLRCDPPGVHAQRPLVPAAAVRLSHDHRGEAADRRRRAAGGRAGHRIQAPRADPRAGALLHHRTGRL